MYTFRQMADISQRQTQIKNRQAGKDAAFNTTTQSVPQTQRGGTPVIENPTAVDASTAKTLPENVKQTLQNQAQVTRREGGEDDQLRNTQEQDTGESEEFLDQIDEGLEVVPNETEETVWEVDDSEKDEIRRGPRFPFIMFTFSVFEWMTVLIFSLAATLFGIIFFPIGIALEVALKSWKTFFAVVLVGWSIWYESRETHSFVSLYRNVVKKPSLKPTNHVSRRLFLTVGIVPIVGDIIPTNPIMVIMTYRAVRKKFKQNK